LLLVVLLSFFRLLKGERTDAMVVVFFLLRMGNCANITLCAVARRYLSETVFCFFLKLQQPVRHESTEALERLRVKLDWTGGKKKNCDYNNE
jgi:hypothetical protein